MKRKLIAIAVLVVLLVSMLSLPAQAATPAQIETAIQNGLNWLVPQQNPDGSWSTPVGEPVATTAFMVTKLCDRAFELKYLSPFDPAYPYRQNVIDGLGFIFRQAIPDAGGIKFAVGGHENYNTGVAMMAIAATRAPGAVVGAPGVVNGWTFKQVLDACVTYFANTQNPDGGWRYFAGNQPSDQSNTGYTVLGLRYAEDPLYGFNCVIPPLVKPNLINWIVAIQTIGGWADGASKYTTVTPWENLLKTGNLLMEMSFVGWDTSHPRVQKAIGFIEREWNNPDLVTNYGIGWKNGPTVMEQAAYCLMKGLQSLGITTLMPPAPANWFDDMSTAIVSAQNNPPGAWPADPYWSDPQLATMFALLTLEKSAPPSPSQANICPNEYKWSTKTKPPYRFSGCLFNSWNQVHFINNGPGDALNVTAEITCTPVNVTVPDGKVSFGNIPAGGGAWSTDDFAMVTDMGNPQDPNKGICWRVEYDDPQGYHHVINNVAKFCGEECAKICP